MGGGKSTRRDHIADPKAANSDSIMPMEGNEWSDVEHSLYVYLKNQFSQATQTPLDDLTNMGIVDWQTLTDFAITANVYEGETFVLDSGNQTLYMPMGVATYVRSSL